MRVCTYTHARAFDSGSSFGMSKQRDISRHVPKEIKSRFVQAFEGTYGFWFEFDGTIRFKDPKGGTLPFAYGKTIDECKVMMKNHEVV